MKYVLNIGMYLSVSYCITRVKKLGKKTKWKITSECKD